MTKCVVSCRGGKYFGGFGFWTLRVLSDTSSFKEGSRGIDQTVV